MSGAAALSDDSSLSVVDVRVEFGGLMAVDGVTFSIARDEIVGLIGPNGAGKTTLVNVLTGFQKPTSGEVVLNGAVITRTTAPWRARHGLARTFQGSRPFGSMTILENVEVSGAGQRLSRSAARARARESLSILGLEALAGQRAADLTTGQERRLQVARALAMHPDFLLLDEPAAGLNEIESDDLFEAIGTLPTQLGCGVVLIEHDMRVVMNTCSRLVVLDRGRVLRDGSPSDVRVDQAVIDAYLGVG